MNPIDHFSTSVSKLTFSYICQYLHLSDIRSLKVVCKKFNDIIKSEIFSKYIIDQHYPNTCFTYLEKSKISYGNFLQEKFKIFNYLPKGLYKSLSLPSRFDTEEIFIYHTPKKNLIEIFNTLKLNNNILIKKNNSLKILEARTHYLFTEHMEKTLRLTITDMHNGTELLANNYIYETLLATDYYAFFIDNKKKGKLFHLEKKEIYPFNLIKQKKGLIITSTYKWFVCLDTYHGMFTFNSESKKSSYFSLPNHTTFKFAFIKNDDIFLVPAIGAEITCWNLTTQEQLSDIPIGDSRPIIDCFLEQNRLVLRTRYLINIIDINARVLQYSFGVFCRSVVFKNLGILAVGSQQSIDIYNIKTCQRIDSFPRTEHSLIKFSVFKNYLFLYEENSNCLRVCDVRKSAPFAQSWTIPLKEEARRFHYLNFLGMMEDYLLITLEKQEPRSFTKILILHINSGVCVKTIKIKRWITQSGMNGVTNLSAQVTVYDSFLMIRGIEKSAPTTEFIHFGNLLKASCVKNPSSHFIVE